MNSGAKNLLVLEALQRRPGATHPELCAMLTQLTRAQVSHGLDILRARGIVRQEGRRPGYTWWPTGKQPRPPGPNVGSRRAARRPLPIASVFAIGDRKVPHAWREGITRPLQEPRA